MRTSKLLRRPWQPETLKRHKDGSVAITLKELGSHERLVIAIGPDGNVHLLRRGLHVGMKRERRERVEKFAHGINAYEALTGSIAGYVQDIVV